MPSIGHEQKNVLHRNELFEQPDGIQELLWQIMNQEDNNNNNYQRLRLAVKPARAIVKGDPREFMG
jgi:hypothetical protein